MANALNTELAGRVVILKESWFKKELRPATRWPFRCENGFGLSPQTIGSRIAGTFLPDGEHASIFGEDIDRFATDDEIATAQALYAHGA